MTQNTSESWVAVVADDGPATALLAALHTLGVAARCPGACTELAHGTAGHAPDLVVLGLVPGLVPGQATGPAGAQHLQWDWDVPVIAIGPAGGSLAAPQAAQLADQLVAMGAHHWQASLVPQDWPLSQAIAKAAHQRDQALRQRIDALQAELVEQRLVARAKGVLMAAQSLTEGEAFSLLRSGAMQSRLPMGDVARSVVDAAIWAEAVNRAGQLRWLSQRCVAAAAQRLARIDPPAARKLQQQAQKRAREILDALDRLPLPAGTRAALTTANATWLALQACLDRRLDLASLAAADQAAELALNAAELLTGALQLVGSSPMLRVVNLCGRQRMRAQRLVKLGLLVRLHGAAGDAAQAQAQADALALMHSFGQTLQELAQLPLGSGDISAAHQRAVVHWQAMGASLQSGHATTLVQSAEALLDSLDALTSCWERSLQLLLG